VGLCNKASKLAVYGRRAGRQREKDDEQEILRTKYLVEAWALLSGHDPRALGPVPGLADPGLEFGVGIDVSVGNALIVATQVRCFDSRRGASWS
jgi:hypothetical protein